MQTTLKREITLVGMGLHSGRPARMVLRPATEGGIRFRRVDVTDRDNVIPARFDLVTDTTLCTLLPNEAGVSLGTVEHIMAALAGTGVTHVLIDIDGPEVPIMDGSARRFVQAILRTGLAPAAGRARAIRVLEPVREGRATSWPSSRRPRRSRSTSTIDFADAAIGHQAAASHGQRRLRPRARRLPHLLPPGRSRGDAGATGSRSAARSTTPSWSRARRC